MLAKFSVTNFKNFKNTFTVDFTKTKSYEFNQECVKNGIVNKALIYGENGTGKSNLGLAIFDLVGHLTTSNKSQNLYRHYINAENYNKPVEFDYLFQFETGTVRYVYQKNTYESFISENIYINEEHVMGIKQAGDGLLKLKLAGAETLNEVYETSESVLPYITSNTRLTDNVTNGLFKEFLRFVKGMLFFRTLDRNSYIGLRTGQGDIAEGIIERGNLADFELFLNESGIECKLGITEIGDSQKIMFLIGDKEYPFYEIASSGTRALAALYYWLQQLEEYHVSFLFIDEFDAFYHHNLSVSISNRIKALPVQTILTTHNTLIMTNDLFRPDCYFLMNDKKLKSLPECTDRDLRFAHNLERMYKAGAFNE